MHLGWRISGVLEIVGAFLGSKCAEDLTDGLADGLDGSRSCFSQQVLELGEDLFDGVQVGRVFRQEDQFGAGRADELAHDLAFVAAEIVHDHDVAGHQGGDENLRDINLETLAVDRAFEQPWGVDPVMAQCSQEGRGVPMAMRNLGVKPHPAWRPAAQRRHIGLGPGLVDEDQTLRRDLVLILGPLRPPPCDVGTVAFASHHGFF